MKIELSPRQLKIQEEIREFVDREICPRADQFDKDGRIPPDTIKMMAAKGYWGAALPLEYGGMGLDMTSAGVLWEEIGRGSASLLSILTVHGMFSQAVLRWGTDEQKNRLLPKLSKGEILGAFALSEPDTGSDAANVETSAEFKDGFYFLNGIKKWISSGTLADVFLVIAQCEGKATAFIMENSAPGLSIEAISGMSGFKAAMLAELRMDDCRIPAENILGEIGFGFSWVGGTGLDFGRYSIACGCVGLAQACLDASLSYADQRKQGGKYLKDHQLIRQMLTDMITGVKAARLLCYQAGYLKDSGDPQSIIDSSIAKYFASTTAFKAASDASQIHGANGCHDGYPVQRFFRDAKIMEIIEGSNQIQQLLISKYTCLQT